LEKTEMGTIIIVALVFGSLLAIAALICGTILLIIKTRDSRITEGKSRTEEAMIIQEIYQGLSKMEQRIESLETILMDSQEKDRHRT
jgi:phage shock protein B